MIKIQLKLIKIQLLNKIKIYFSFYKDQIKLAPKYPSGIPRTYLQPAQPGDKFAMRGPEGNSKLIPIIPLQKKKSQSYNNPLNQRFRCQSNRLQSFTNSQKRQTMLPNRRRRVNSKSTTAKTTSTTKRQPRPKLAGEYTKRVKMSIR